MKKIVSVLLLFALLLALCACGAAEEVNLPLPGGLRFGMSPEEVADLLEKKLGDTEHGEAYSLSYRKRPEGFDPDRRLSPSGTSVLVEYTDGKLSRVYYLVYLQESGTAATRDVIAGAETYYTELLGEPVTKFQDPTLGRSFMWEKGKLSLSLLSTTMGGIPSLSLDFTYDDAN